MNEKVYEPEVEPNPDSPERDDNAERIRLSAEARKRLLQVHAQLFVAGLDRQMRKRSEPPWWIDVLAVLGTVALRLWPVWIAIGLWFAFR